MLLLSAAMNDTTHNAPQVASDAKAWARPAYEVIALDCEITAYAPDGDFPLF